MDDLGFATLVFVHQDCEQGGTLWVFFLLEVPDAVRRADAVHGGVVMAWGDDDGVLAASQSAGFAMERHAMQASLVDVGAFITARIQGDPDLLVTLHATGSPSPLPFDVLRLVDVNDGTVGAVMDRARPALAGPSGVASAQLLLTVDDALRLNPATEHKAGLGSVSMDSVDVQLAFMAGT